MTTPVRFANVRVDIDYANPALKDSSLAAVPAEGLDAGGASRIALHVTAEEIACYERHGDDLVIVLYSGERLWLKDYFQSDDDGIAQLLVLDEAMDGFAEVSLAEDGDGCLMPIVLAGAAGAAVEDAAAGSALPIGLASLGGIAAVALAAAGGSDGSGKKPQSAGSGTDGDGTGDGHPGKPGGGTDIDASPSGPDVDGLHVMQSADGAITVGGKTAPGALLTITFPDGTSDSLAVPESGSFRVNSPAGVVQPDGEVQAQASLRGVAGEVARVPYHPADTDGEQEKPQALVVEELAVADNGDGTIVVSGRCEAGSTVRVAFTRGPDVTIDVGDDGRFSVHSPAGFAQRDGTIVVQASLGDATGPEKMIDYIDTIAPPAPVIDGAHDADGAQGDTITPDSKLVFTGTGEPISTVTVFLHDGSGIIVGGTGIVGMDGTWSIEYDHVALKPRPYTVTAVQTDINGNSSDSSSEFALQIRPPSPDGSAGSEGSGDGGNGEEAGVLSGPTVSVFWARENADGSIRAGGGTEPGSTVVVQFPDGSRAIVIADASGAFETNSAVGVSQPDGSVYAQAEKDGECGPVEMVFYEVTVDEMPDRQPGTGGQEGGGETEEEAAAGGGLESAELPVPRVTGIAEEKVMSGLNDVYTSDRSVTFLGEGEPGTRVDVYLNQESGGDRIWVGEAVVQDNGTWQLDYTHVTLPLDRYEVRARTLGLGGESSDFSRSLALHVIPKPPVISGVDEDTGESATDGVTSDTTLVTYGTNGEPGALIELFLYDGKRYTLLGEARADPDGTWRVDHTDTPLPEGVYELTARQTSASGMMSKTAGAFRLVVEASAEPAGPEAADLALAEHIDGGISVSGHCEAGSTVEVTFPDGSTAIVGVGSGNRFDVESPAGVAQPEGPVRVVAMKDGVRGPEATIAYVDMLDPLPPVIERVENDTGKEGDGITADTTLVFAGTGEAGARIAVFHETERFLVKIGDSIVGADGTWRIDHTDTELDPGHYVVKAQQTDVNGRVSNHSATFELTVDTSVPPAPLVIGIAEEARLGPDTLATSHRKVTFYGTGEPEMRVDVYLDPAKGGDRIWLGDATVQKDGAWRLDDALVELALGEYVVRANQTGLNGLNSNLSTGFTLKVVPQAPFILGIDEDTGESANDGVTSDTTLATYGTDGEPGALLELFQYDAMGYYRLGDATVEPDGTWRVDHTDIVLAEGEYELTARQTSANGMTSEFSDGFQLVIRPATSQSLSITGIAEDTGISDSDAISMETEPAFWIEGGEIGSTLVVTVGGREVGSTVVESGSPMLARYRGEPLEDGTYEALVTEITADGLVSRAALPFTFVVDTQAPDAPVVTGISPDTGDSATDGWTSANRLVIEGRGEPGHAVAVYVDGGLIGQTPVKSDGSWWFNYRYHALEEGEYRITAQQGDVAGNRSGLSEAFTVHVDRTADAPVIQGIGGMPGTVERPATGPSDDRDPTRIQIEPTHPVLHGHGSSGTGDVVISRVVHAGNQDDQVSSSESAGPVREDAPFPEDDRDAVSGGRLPHSGSEYQGGALPTFEVTSTVSVTDCWAVQEAAPTEGVAVDPFRQSASGDGRGNGSCLASRPAIDDGAEPAHGATPSPVSVSGTGLPTLAVAATIVISDRWHVQEAISSFAGDGPNPFYQGTPGGDRGHAAPPTGPSLPTPAEFFTGINVGASHDAATRPPQECDRSERSPDAVLVSARPLPDHGATRAFGLEKSHLAEISELFADEDPDETGLAWAFPDAAADTGLHDIAGYDPSRSPLPDWDHATFM